MRAGLSKRTARGAAIAPGAMHQPSPVGKHSTAVLSKA
jgi:hypothetical protein